MILENKVNYKDKDIIFFHRLSKLPYSNINFKVADFKNSIFKMSKVIEFLSQHGIKISGSMYKAFLSIGGI